MKSHLRWLTSWALLAGTIWLGPTAVASAAALLRAQHDHGAQAAPSVNDRKPKSTAASMGNMAAMDAQLNGLVAEMNQATGDAKIAAMAKVLTMLVEQRTEMRQQMMTRMGQMQDRDQMMMQMMQQMHTMMPESAHGQSTTKKDTPDTKEQK
jgi:hypothetical protein